MGRYKSDVKPVFTSASNAVLFTGPTRLRGFMIQSTGSAGTAIINIISYIGIIVVN